MAINAKQLLSRNETLKEDRTLWDGFYQDVVDGKEALQVAQVDTFRGIWTVLECYLLKYINEDKVIL